MAFVAVVSESQGARRSVKFVGERAPFLKDVRGSAYAGRILQSLTGCYDQTNLRDKFRCIGSIYSMGFMYFNLRAAVCLSDLMVFAKFSTMFLKC